MPNPVSSYVNSILKKFEQYATWPPNSRIRLGDIGILEGNRFRYRANIETMGIKFTFHSNPTIDFDHSSGFNIAPSVHVAGEAKIAEPINGKAKAQASFDSSGAFVLQAAGIRAYEIDDKLKLARDIRELYDRGLWHPDWLVVESTYEAERATIIVSNSEGGKLELSAKGGFPTGIAPLATAQGDLAIIGRSGDFSTYLAEQGLTPMFGLLRVKRSFFEVAKDLVFRVHDQTEVVEKMPPKIPAQARP
jgi:hypothetical protein